MQGSAEKISCEPHFLEKSLRGPQLFKTNIVMTRKILLKKYIKISSKIAHLKSFC